MKLRFPNPFRPGQQRWERKMHGNVPKPPAADAPEGVPGKGPVREKSPGSPTPAPGLTPGERSALAELATWDWEPQARDNGRLFADALRLTVPHLPDTDIAKIALFTHYHTAALAAIMPSHYWALRLHLDALACAALDLTELDRAETPT